MHTLATLGRGRSGTIRHFRTPAFSGSKRREFGL
jgi:hypothetical protein